VLINRIGSIFYAMVEYVRFAYVVMPCDALTMNQGGGGAVKSVLMYYGIAQQCLASIYES